MKEVAPKAPHRSTVLKREKNLEVLKKIKKLR